MQWKIIFSHKKQNLTICNNIDLEGIMLSQVRERQVPHGMWNVRNKEMNKHLFCHSAFPIQTVSLGNQIVDKQKFLLMELFQLTREKKNL